MSMQHAIFIMITLIISNFAFADKRTDLQLKELIQQDCGSCHGMTLKGGLGPSLLPEALKNKPDEYLFTVIQYGLAAKAMPPWQGILSKQQTLQVIKLLRNGLKTNTNAKLD